MELNYRDDDNLILTIQMDSLVEIGLSSVGVGISTIELLTVVGPEGVIVVGIRVNELAAVATFEVHPVFAVGLHHVLSIVNHKLTVLVRIVESIVVTNAAVELTRRTVVGHMTSIRH